MNAFENGADGVLIAGCLEGGCHFAEGNLFAKRRVNYIRDMLTEIGLEKERLRMVNISAAMARPLADTIIDMVQTVRKLGPSPLKPNQKYLKFSSLEFKNPLLKKVRAVFTNFCGVESNGSLKQESCS